MKKTTSAPLPRDDTGPRDPILDLLLHQPARHDQPQDILQTSGITRSDVCTWLGRRQEALPAGPCRAYWCAECGISPAGTLSWTPSDWKAFRARFPSARPWEMRWIARRLDTGSHAHDASGNRGRYTIIPVPDPAANLPPQHWRVDIAAWHQTGQVTGESTDQNFPTVQQAKLWVRTHDGEILGDAWEGVPPPHDDTPPISCEEVFDVIAPGDDLQWPRDRDQMIALLLLDAPGPGEDRKHHHSLDVLWWQGVRREEIASWIQKHSGGPLRGPCLARWCSILRLPEQEWMLHERPCDWTAFRQQFPSARPWPLIWSGTRSSYVFVTYRAHGYRMHYQICPAIRESMSATSWILEQSPDGWFSPTQQIPGCPSAFPTSEAAQAWAVAYERELFQGM